MWKKAEDNMLGAKQSGRCVWTCGSSDGLRRVIRTNQFVCVFGACTRCPRLGNKRCEDGNTDMSLA